MAPLEYINNNSLTEPLIEVVSQSNMFQNLVMSHGKRNSKATASKSGRANSFMANTMHGMTNNERAIKLMQWCGLKMETQVLITATQCQALNTRHHQTQILRLNDDLEHCIYKETNETVSHMSNMYPKINSKNDLTGQQFIHNSYRNICQHCRIKTSHTPWKYHPEPIMENREVKVLWNLKIRTDKVIPTRRQDIVVIDKS